MTLLEREAICRAVWGAPSPDRVLLVAKVEAGAGVPTMSRAERTKIEEEIRKLEVKNG